MLHTLLFLLSLTVEPGELSSQQPGTADHPQWTAAQAQDVDPPRGRPGRGALSPMEVVNMLDAYAIVQARNALQLDDPQYGPFVTRLKQLHQTRRQAQQERHRILQQLRRLTAPQVVDVDENAVRANLRALRELDDRAAADIRKAYDAVDELLNPRQQARFRVFEETLERRKLDLLMRARQGAIPSRR